MKIYFAHGIAIAVLLAGCARSTNEDMRSRDIILQAPRDRIDGDAVRLRQVNFEGSYAIVGVERYGAAENFAGRKETYLTEYSDGILTVAVDALPYGVRLRITNRLAETLTLDASRSSFIDFENYGHPVELRATASLYPSTVPMRQEYPIPPDTTCRIDFDVILPIYRDEILARARTAKERGAFLVTDGPLPVFSSGYFVPDDGSIERVRELGKWSFGRTFGVHLALRGDDASYPLTLRIKPFRFTFYPTVNE